MVALGARGVFGSLLVRELEAKYDVVPAGRGDFAKPFLSGTCGGWVEARAGERAVRIMSADQRIAILPLVFALERIATLRGCHAPSVFDAEELLQFIQ